MAYTTRYSWDASTQGWAQNGNDGTATLTRVTPGLDGSAGALQVAYTGIPTGGYAQLQVWDAGGLLGGTLAGDTLTVVVKQTSGGSGWTVRTMFDGPAPNYDTFNGTLVGLTSGGAAVTVVDTYAGTTPGNVVPTAFEVQFVNSNNTVATATFQIDTYAQGTPAATGTLTANTGVGQATGSAALTTVPAAAPPVTTRFGVHWVDFATDQNAVPVWSSLTHLHLFSASINANGTLAHNWTSARRAAMVSAAHAAGKKIICVIGGQGRCDGLASALSSTYRATFVGNLAALVTGEGFDGLDFDFEGVSFSAPNTVSMTSSLRSTLGSTPELYFTPDWYGTATTYTGLQPYVTQINPMTYLMQGTYADGWSASTHHSPIINSGTANGLPSIATIVNDYIAAGWAPAKIGIGGSWVGKLYNGRNAPGVATSGGESIDGTEYDYSAIQGMGGTFHNSPDWGSYRSYGSSFMSYDDETSMPHKFDYATGRGLGGVFVWYGQSLGGFTAPTNAMAAKLAASASPTGAALTANTGAGQSGSSAARLNLPRPLGGAPAAGQSGGAATQLNMAQALAALTGVGQAGGSADFIRPTVVHALTAVTGNGQSTGHADLTTVPFLYASVQVRAGGTPVAQIRPGG